MLNEHTTYIKPEDMDKNKEKEVNIIIPEATVYESKIEDKEENNKGTAFGMDPSFYREN